MAPYVHIASSITLDTDDLDPSVVQQICAALTIPNPDKPRAMKELVRGAERMPDFHELFSIENFRLVLPRGFLWQLQQGFRKLGIPLELDDHRQFHAEPPRGWGAPKAIALRPYQEIACRAILANPNGMIKAPPGAGKTVLCLEAIRRAAQPTLIIVDKNSIAEQWRDRCIEFLGVEPGMIGEGVWEERPITIALRQTLWAHRDDRISIDSRYLSFWHYWGFVVLDECHHAIAPTLIDLIQRFTAFWRIGLSATPLREPETFPIAKATIGPIVHQTTLADLGESHIKPKVEVCKTDFNFDYIPTHRVQNTSGQWYVVRNNYNSMMSDLAADTERNELIANLALSQAFLYNKCVLIISRRKGHIKNIAEIIEHIKNVSDYSIPIYMLTGDQRGKDAMKIRDNIESHGAPCILLSTIAEEALDVPRLDVIILAYPARNVTVIEQQIGRVMRSRTGKTEARVIDIVDWNIDLIRDQYYERSRDLYRKLDLEVEVLDANLLCTHQRA